ncbi:ribonuclease H-like protein [Auriscalpium vulgare]|uniref:Ribonuclease H-like protein n=1 Tax=Auriscalpium vulgare TaxID=40419 RepID=A0ACB8RRB0_9AGAM|nr:ribonuclease H-like protein [Auriscalpium vulgare]
MTTAFIGFLEIVKPESRKFTPPGPDIRPSDLFALRTLQDGLAFWTRFVRISNSREMLIFTDGACRNNGRENARGGWAAVFNDTSPSPISGRLEGRAARRDRRAHVPLVASEGFSRIVIATDSQYTVLGITEWVQRWERNGWRQAEGRPVENQDLWRELQEKVCELEAAGAVVQFWDIPREWNTMADRQAAAAADVVQDVQEYAVALVDAP